MVFSSLFFVYFFFPICMACYFLSPSIPRKNLILLIFSLIFYAWGGPLFLLLLLSDCFISWFCTLKISENDENPRHKKYWLILDIVLLLGLLGIFKYGMFFMSGVRFITGFPDEILSIVLPIGISFYTFQLISYSVDVYRREVEAQKSFPRLLLYACLFHQCIAGPIVRYKQVAEDIGARKPSVSDVSDGIYRFALGLAKKAVLANGCAVIADTLLSEELLSGSSVCGLWLGIFAYALQIYLDFSAYSDMAIGMGRMIGFHYPENFQYPYCCSSIKDFWRRWHISLGTFFRDYVYIPLGGNRVSKKRWCLNLLIVWSLTGLWHGASMNYVIWGLYFFVFLVMEKLFLQKVLDRCPHFIGHLYALFVVILGWVIFRFSTVSSIFTVLKGLFGMNRNVFLDFGTKILAKNNIFFLLFATISCTPLYKYCHDKLLTHFEKSGTAYPILIWDMLLPLLCLLLSLTALVGNSYNPFLYFQF